LISQVAGRTGRSAKGGRVLVQTASPDQPAIKFAATHDYLGFANGELRHRKALNVPPFTHLVRMILRGPDEELLKSTAEAAGNLLRARIAELKLDVRILGPAPCLVTRLKANYRYHLQMTAADLETLKRLWLESVPDMPGHPTIEFTVDVDPLNMR
jgi:primosomal protein N' (replication factor Y)